MKVSELCAEANWLFGEEQRLMKQDDPSVPEGTVTYKHAVMYYVKKNGTKSRYEYTYPYVRIWTIVNKVDKQNDRKKSFQLD